MKYSQAISIQLSWDCFCLYHLGVMCGWHMYLYPKSMLYEPGSYPNVGHWDGTPGSFLHLSHNLWWWRYLIYKILDMNSIFTWLIAWKDFTATSWLYCIALLCKNALMCSHNKKSVNIHDLLRTNISPR